MKLVIDSNVFAKLFINEADSNIARELFKHCVSQEVKLLAPSLFEYELLQIALYYKYPIQDVLLQLDQYQRFNLSLVKPNKDIWLKTEEIVQQGHKSSGFPSLYDSVYHALAISNNCNFVTADKRHVAKTKQLGRIVLLNQWNTEGIF